MSSSEIRPPLVAALLWVVAAVPAAAQAPLALPTVTVEGAPVAAAVGKTPLPLNETPQSVSVIRQEDLRDRPPVRSVAEALTYAPGLLGETFGGDTRNDWFRIRGFEAQAQSYFADGLQLPSNAFATWRLDPFTIDSIEVLRGPASALYGASGPGGLINATTKLAAPGNFGEAVLSYDEHGQGFGGIDVNRGDERLAFRLALSGRAGGTEVDFVEDDGYAVAPSLRWSPDARTTVEVYASVLADRTNGQNFLPYVGTEVEAPFGYIDRERFTSEPELDRFERDQWLVGARYEQEFGGGLTLRQNLRYGELDVDFRTLYGNGYVLPGAETAELARLNFITTPHAELLNVDNQLEFALTTGPAAHTVLLGLEYKRYELEDEQGAEVSTTLDLLDPVYLGADPLESRYIDDDSTQQQIGVYAQDAIRAGNWSVLATGRADYVDLKVENRLDPNGDYASDETEFSGRLGVLYSFANGLAPYASVSRSFLPVVGRATLTGEPFEAETATQLEAGVKWTPGLWDAELTASVFNLVRENVTQADAAFATSQIGEVTARGFELEARAEPRPGLSLRAAALVSEVEVTEGTEIDDGNLPTATPETILSAYADYTQPGGPLAGLGAGLGLRYIGSSFADRGNAFEVGASTLLDAAVHYDLPQFPGARVTLAASNLTDARYVASCNGETSCFYGAGRTASLSLGYRW